MSTSTDKPAGEVVRSQRATEVQRRFADMAMMLPQADGDGSARIVEALLDAADPFSLNTPWETESSKDLDGAVLVIEDLTAQRSDFADGLGVFLVVHAVTKRTGEPVTFTTGAVSVVAQLVRAYVMGWLPMLVEVVKSERPTKDGYYPIHLRVIEAATGKAGATDGA